MFVIKQSTVLFKIWIRILQEIINILNIASVIQKASFYITLKTRLTTVETLMAFSP